MKNCMLLALALFAGCAGPHRPYDQGSPNPPRAAPTPQERIILHGARSTMSSTLGAWPATACYAQVFMNRSGGRMTVNTARDGPDDRWLVHVTEPVPGGAYLALIRVAPARSGSNAEMFTASLAPFGGSEVFRRAMAERCR